MTYHHFIDAAERPLAIMIKVGVQVDAVEGIDILHWGEAASTFDPDDYDASRRPRG